MKDTKRIIYSDKLPRYTEGRYRNKINWKESIGCKVQFIYDDITGYVEIIEYNKITKELIIKHNNLESIILCGNFLKCKLGTILKKYTSEFKLEIGDRFQDNKRDIIIVDKEYRLKYDNKNKKYNMKYYKYKCNRCRYNEGWIVEYDLLKGHGCSCCHGLTTVLGINTIWDTARWMCDLGVSEEDAKTHTHGSNNKVSVICPDCKLEKMVKICDLYTNHSISCKCGDGFSYGHKYIFSLLTQLKQDFIDNYTFDWCKFYNLYKEKEVSGEYDFILEDKNIIIEVDGGFHRTDNNRSGQTKEESIFLDNEKDKLALDNGYKVIRIIYNDDNLNIKQNIILNKYLNILFDLSNIDWTKCEEFALSNRVKEACKLKNNNLEMTTTEIGLILNISSDSVRNYLKKGNKLGWCYYNAKEEQIRNSIKTGYKVTKKIEVFKNGESLGVFESIKCLIDKSKKILEVQLCRNGIREQIKNNTESYKGFTFNISS